jgi:hypothetical protein
MNERPNAEEFDESRELCDDGNCLGVVVGGKCNVCGLTAAAAGTSPRDPGSGQTGGGNITVDAPADMVAEGGHTTTPSTARSASSAPTAPAPAS